MKILYLLSRVPYPIDKGDKLRAYHQLRILKKSNEISLFCLNDSKGMNIEPDELLKIADRYEIFSLSKLKIVINLLEAVFSNLPFQTYYFYSKRIQNELIRTISEFKPDIIVCQLIRMAKYLDEGVNVPVVIDYVDVLSKGLERREQSSMGIIRQIFKAEHKRVLDYEKYVFEKYRNAVIITENDRDELPLIDRNLIKIVPNGIDTQNFKRTPSEKDIDLIFAGNMSYPPNIDAVEFIVKKVLPIIRTTHPGINFYIVGSSPSARIRKLQSRNVIVTGWVKDIKHFYNRAKIFLAPMQIGTGLQNKILEAMSMSIPCIISSLAQRGIQAENNENLFVADDPVKISELIVKLLGDTELREIIGEKGRRFVSERYDWNVIVKEFENYLSNIVNNTDHEV
ncbi:MAG: glycosyltransferase [Melioribacteraceae bacterium]|nr:glycosyltransferase [Melioribacteraceae bacterium]